jgi:hypothetical protein
VPWCDSGNEPRVQWTWQDGINLMHRHLLVKHQYHVRLAAPELAKALTTDRPFANPAWS